MWRVGLPALTGIGVVGIYTGFAKSSEDESVVSILRNMLSKHNFLITAEAKGFFGWGRHETKTAPKVDEMTLKQVQIFFRHGARTPLHLIHGIEQAVYDSSEIMPVLPHTDFKYDVINILTGEIENIGGVETKYRRKVLKGGSYSGQLTKRGQDQVYELGVSIRKRYIDDLAFMNAQFKPTDIYIRSTNIARTLDSLRCVLSGFYGIEELTRQGPIGFLVSDQNNEILYPNNHCCACLKKLTQNVLANFGDFPGIKEDRLRLEAALGVNSSLRPDEKLSFLVARDDIVARKAQDLPMPKAVEKFDDLIEKYGLLSMEYAHSGCFPENAKQLLRMSAGPMWNLVLEGLNAVRKGDKYHKMYLYSCHDTSLLVLLKSLDAYDARWPPFAADLRLETYEDKKGKYWIKTSYCGEPLHIPVCKGDVCSLKKFVKAISKYAVNREEFAVCCGEEPPPIIQVPGKVSAEFEERADVAAGM